MLPNEIVNKIIMMSIPQYNYMIELKFDINHIKNWNKWNKKVNPYTHKDMTLIKMTNNRYINRINEPDFYDYLDENYFNNDDYDDDDY